MLMGSFLNNMKYLITSILLFLSLPLQVNAYQLIPVNLITGTETEFIIRVLSKENNFDEETAVRIAICESRLGKYKTNWQGSSAYGLYQFKPATFSYYCLGNIQNDYDQIICFIKLYNKYPHYWECK